MGHHARKLAAIVAVLALSAVLAPGADASTALVRVETPSDASSFSSTVPRQAVTLGVAAVTKAGRTCEADTAAAALSAAIGDAAWEATDTGSALKITKLKGLASPTSAAPSWSWATFVDQHYVADPCHATVPDTSEVLFFPACTVRTGVQGSCFTGGPLYPKVNGGTPYPTKPVLVGGDNTFVSVWIDEDAFDPAAVTTSIGPSTDSVLTTDEGYSATSNDAQRQGIAVIRLAAWGDHKLRVTENGKVPGRVDVCATDGADGFCGTVKPDFTPFDVNANPSPCATNGHDGFCGTTDTSGPIAHITNIAQKQVFKKKKGPGQLKGTIETDPNGVKDVKLRLTRVTTSRVLIKATKKKAKKASAAKAKKKAKKRYRTVKRCSVWDDSTALLETATCGKKGKWFQGELSDLRDAFTYGFAMTLPNGVYTLEVLASDENGYPDVATPGRSVVTFTVS
jgi:hypothetical protein